VYIISAMELAVKLDLNVIIKFFKNGVTLAKLLDIEPSAISNWKIRGVPSHRATQIEKLSDGHFKRAQIPTSKPDVFS